MERLNGSPRWPNVGQIARGNSISDHPRIRGADAAGSAHTGHFVLWDDVIVVVDIEGPGGLQLAHIVKARSLLTFALGLRQTGQKQPGQNCDDRNYHQ